MPRVILGGHREELDKLRETFPRQRFLRRSEVSDYTGIKDPHTVAEFLDGITRYSFNKKEFCYDIEDIAKRIWQSIQ